MTALSTRTPHPSLGTAFRSLRYEYPVVYVTRIERATTGNTAGQVWVRMESDDLKRVVHLRLFQVALEWEEVKGANR